ncbi:MAG: large conductance mechanosensitive channel protein MscL [Candidatus Andersenbacteria bacterium]
MQIKGRKFFDEFKEFALRGNVVDLAIGIVIGSSLTAITNSLVKDVIMPPLGLVLQGVDFSRLFIDLSGKGYKTLTQAQAVGAPTINYGLFLNAIIDFLVIAFVIFIVIKQINRLQRKERQQPTDPTQKNCPYCALSIPVQASRCPHCTSAITV